MSLIILFLFIYNTNCEFVSIKNPSNITLGSLSGEYAEHTNVNSVLETHYDINSSRIHYSKIENNYEILSNEMHPFIKAVHVAYSNHLNLIITPDMIWYLISSGTSYYINKNAEQLREIFVDHEGQKFIKIYKNSFLFNSSSNEWEIVVDEFVNELQKSLKLNVQSLFNSNFSTTNRVSSVVSKVVLMESMQKYFVYKLITKCGIPEVKLMGSKNDWLLIKSKLESLNKTLPKLQVWFNQLDEILNEFINVYENRTNFKFWTDIYKRNEISGISFISGWVIALFPYLKNNTENYFVWKKHWTDAYTHENMPGLVTADYPMSLSKVPFVWDYYGKEYNMSFFAGMFGVNYEPETRSVMPVFGFAVTQ